MKVLRIFGIVAAVHLLAFLLIMANPGCSTKPKSAPPAPEATKATSSDASSPSISVPSGDAQAADQSPISAAPMSSPSQGLGFDPNAPAGPAVYSPTRPGTVAAAALQPSTPDEVTPATTVTVGRGDSLWTIAKKNKISVKDLAAANSLKTSAVLHVGQKLVVPTKALGAASTEAPVDLATTVQPSRAKSPATPKAVPTGTFHHKVQPGESLGSIARKYGVKQGVIAEANNISNPALLRVGRELVIPGWQATKGQSEHKAAKPGKSAPAADASTEAQSEAAPATSTAPEMPKIGIPGPDQDLDAGLKKTTPGDGAGVPVIKIEDSSSTQSSGTSDSTPQS